MNKISIRHIVGLITVGSMIFLFACQEGSVGDDKSNKVEVDKLEKEQSGTKHMKSIMYLLPSPMEMSVLLQKAGADYDPSILHDFMAADQYVTAKDQALNVGIYGADLSYASVFNQTNEVMFYLSTMKKLSENLGISGAFDNETQARIEANIDNRDTVMAFISESMETLDEYLKQNDRANLSALIVAGGWVEGLHISYELLSKSENNKALVRQIAEQKFVITDLMNLLKMYDDEAVNKVRQGLLPLSKIYAEVDIQQEQPTAETDEQSNKTTINAASEVNITSAQLDKIRQQVIELRARYTGS